ncbi:hypothetical protein EJB05_07749 [Eragrostis curvula]|uniref:Peptidase S59 domain-containing protein n=1 Tax=Eragrostis curvula TaxID=38414 RepID=A0A5J9WLH5_9POAL|nr:hypothetical protein EJB05_07749 [Eragrostis curvula]
MPEYKDKSHEELRWEDYQRGDKGGPNPSGTPAPQPNPFSQVNPNQFTSAPTSNPFATTSPAPGTTSTFNSSFNPPTASSNPFTSSTNTTLFGQTGGSVFSTSSSSLFSNTNPAFASSSLFGPSSNPSPFSTGVSPSTQSVGLFSSSPAFVQQSSSTPAFSTTGSLFSTPSLFGSGSSPFSTPTFQQSAPAQTSNMFSFQPTSQPALGGFTGFSNTTSQAPIGQPTPSQSNMVLQPAPISHPYGTLPAMPQMSIGNAGSSPSVQYGISSLPVAEKPLPSRTLSMVVPRHLSQRRIKLHPRKYNPISDGKVPFFADDEESTATPKADAFFIPRENPRNLIIRPIDQWPSRSGIDRKQVSKDSADSEKYKGASTESARDKTAMSPSMPSPVENGNHREPGTVTRHGNNASVERLMPKLPHGDYFTEPSLEELAAKERAEPGYCSRVRDFVVGRHGYGSIKFLGETDVRSLDLESIVEFNNREVIVYKDDSKKPPVGEGLNKAAEVTLLNIKCINKKTGDEYREGPRVDKYKEMLVKKAEEQGAVFVSFDPAKGEWKFRVKHFSAYGFW